LTISGNFTSNPADTVVTTQFAPSTVVGPGVEFTGSFYFFTFQETINISVDFGPNDLTIVFTSPDDLAAFSSFKEIAGLHFSGLPSSFTGYDTLNYTCNPALGPLCDPGSVSGLSTENFSPGTLTLSFTKIVAGDTYVFGSPLTAPAIPEPSTFALLGTGMLGVAGGLRRRFAPRA